MGPASVDLTDSTESLISFNGNMNCSCEMKVNDKNLEVVKCIVCNMHCHSACQGFLKLSLVPQKFVCIKCGEKPGHVASDKFSARDGDEHKKTLCRLR